MLIVTMDERGAEVGVCDVISPARIYTTLGTFWLLLLHSTHHRLRHVLGGRMQELHLLLPDFLRSGWGYFSRRALEQSAILARPPRAPF